jgi:hypothetical protein
MIGDALRGLFGFARGGLLRRRSSGYCALLWNVWNGGRERSADSRGDGGAACDFDGAVFRLINYWFVPPIQRVTRIRTSTHETETER